MKHFKIFVSLMLVCMMMLAVVTTASAVGNNGTITINNAKTGATYSIYKILDLASYDSDLNAYKYKTETDWKEFFQNNNYAKALFNYSVKDDIVTLKASLPNPIPATDIQNFAKAALEYAGGKLIQPTETKIVDNAETEETSVQFTGLELGYYLVQSSIGTVLSLNTTNPNATINDKNANTKVTKTVDKNNVSIGDKVTFTIKVDLEKNIDHAPAAVTGFINDLLIHDKMDSTLSLINDSFTVSATRDGSYFDCTTHYSITYDQPDQEGASENCTFHVSFVNDYFKAGDIITIRYEAILNETAVIGQPGNKNEAYATYGGHTTPKTEVKVYTGMLTIDKYAEGDNTKKLSGAGFILRNFEDKYYKVTLIDETEADTSDITIPSNLEGKVQKVEWVNNEAEATMLMTDNQGKIVFAGIPAGTYRIVEKVAPNGFNKILDPVIVVISSTDDGIADPPVVSYKATIEVPNKTGVILPGTGGIGTTLFIVFGSIAVIAAGVILVARRRMKLMVD